MLATAPKRLDVATKQSVSYCIPLWQRDHQVALAIERVKDRLRAPLPVGQTRRDPVAVVCFGPSLNQTWKRLKKYRYIISCSGSHKFLVERGLTPTWHVEVDPRPHKVDLIGPPQAKTEYLIASTCHPKVFDHLDGYTVKLWHVFATEEEAQRTLPPGEVSLTGGSSVGLRALTIARFLGFVNLHVFGMDGCEGESGKHADLHPNQPKDHSVCEYDGVEYRTTASMLECARQTWHELDQMPDVRATFYGRGLVQAMAKHYTPRRLSIAPAIAVLKPTLITPEYVQLNAQLHRDNAAYGIGGAKHAPTVLKLVETIQTRSVLDYGCGKGQLAKALDFPIWEYDPAIPGKDVTPRPADLVVCSDVLEHIEPDKLTPVLHDLQRCVRKVGFFVIHTGPAQKTLADGRNAHLIQKSLAWWQRKLERFFTIGSITQKGPELFVVVGPHHPQPKGQV